MDIKRNIERILSLKNKYEGKRIFIVGTGPSLNKINFELIKDEILFGVNTLYRGYEKFGISPQYYACSDMHVWNAHDENLLSLETLLVLTGGAGGEYKANLNYYQAVQKQEPILLTTLGYVFQGNFSTDLTKGVYNGDTIVIDICLQASLYMGFDKVYLLGCDCDYKDGKHRFDGLQTENIRGGGVTNHWEKSFKSYEISKLEYEKYGKEIINCTPNSKLNIFEKKKLEEII
ncbi:MAG: DUF115 domain-containing protein [Candidatus Heimdallarchaeota archaeon]|nr:DUF115 domain-containing protein [Candidatus Heimdallarchaeota archaeon]